MGRTLDFLPVTSADHRRWVERRLPRFLFDYIDGGANDELTLAANLEAFRRLGLRQRVLRDVSAVDTTTTLAGEPAAMPLALAPVGLAGLMARRGEVLGVRAAEAAGIPFTLSTVGICSLREVRAAAAKPFWFQLYMLRDRTAVRRLLDGAAEAGCTTLVFTVDLAVAGLRQRDVRNGMLDGGLRGKLFRAGQILRRPGWILNVGLRGGPHHFGSLVDLVAVPTDIQASRVWMGTQFDPGVTLKDIAWLRGIWKGRLLLKGILEPEDASAAVEVGADGVIVSNHGGRQLDSVAPSLAKLPGVVQAVAGRAEVLLDGGVRSGLDVFKAVALGARGVLIGRPWVWALAGSGQSGLEDLLGTFRKELAVAMALCGVNRIGEVGPELLEVLEAAPPWPAAGA
ncbi:MAG: L-lactate dehydrogenase [Holophaga sp.]|jgi:L-lactate dehydrogenase (cytochrome)